jgi:hypothetical protein
MTAWCLQRVTHRAFLVLAIAAAALLQGCGGSSGGGSSEVPYTPALVAVDTGGSGGDGVGGDSAGGTAGDGAPIVGGLVTVTDSTGRTATTTTGSDGTWRVKISGFTGPLLARVVKGSRQLVSFSPLSPRPDARVPMNITGLTDKIASDLVAATGEAGSAKLTPSIVSARIASVGASIRILNTSIEPLLRQNGLDPASFDPITAPFTTNHTGYDAVLDSLQVSNSPNGATSVRVLTPVEVTQQLFGVLRSTVGAYSNDQDTGDLDVAGTKLGDAIKAAIAPLDEDMLQLVVNGLAQGSQLYNNYRNGTSFAVTTGFGGTVFGQVQTRNAQGQAVTPANLALYGCELEKVTTVQTAAGDTDVSATRFAGSFPLSATTTAPVVPPAEVNAFVCYTFGASGRLIGTLLDDGATRSMAVRFFPQADGSWRYMNTVTRRPVDLTGQYATLTARTGTPEGTPRYGTIARTVNATGENTLFRIRGQLRAAFGQLNTRTVAEWNSLAHYAVDIEGSEATVGNLKTTRLAGTSTLLKADGTVHSTGTIGAGSFIEDSVIPPNTLRMAVNLSVLAPNVKFEGVFNESEPKADASGRVVEPTRRSYTGKLYEGDGAGGHRLLLDGTITKTEVNREQVTLGGAPTATNFIRTDIGFSGRLLLQNRAESSLTLAIKDESLTTESFTGRFSTEAGTFDISGSRNRVDGSRTVTVKSTTGVTFTIPANGSGTPQKIFKDGTETGTITLDTKRIVYADGKFEQF